MFDLLTFNINCNRQLSNVIYVFFKNMFFSFDSDCGSWSKRRHNHTKQQKCCFPLRLVQSMGHVFDFHKLNCKRQQRTKTCFFVSLAATDLWDAGSPCAIDAGKTSSSGVTSVPEYSFPFCSAAHLQQTQCKLNDSLWQKRGTPGRWYHTQRNNCQQHQPQHKPNKNPAKILAGDRNRILGETACSHTQYFFSMPMHCHVEVQPIPRQKKGFRRPKCPMKQSWLRQVLANKHKKNSRTQTAQRNSFRWAKIKEIIAA